MIDHSADPALEAAQIWADALTLLKHDSTLTPREKGWLEGVSAEAVYGPVIMLCVDNAETLSAIQSSLYDQLTKALKIATGNDMSPAFKVVPRPVPQQVTSPLPEELTPTVADFGKESFGAQTAPMPDEHPSVIETPFTPNASVNLDPVTHLNKTLTFDSFVPGDSNRFARTVALTVAEGTGKDFNPLCIYGGSGLGKTHLLNAIGNYALVKDPGIKVRYVTSEEFTNEFIEALQDPKHTQGQIREFNLRYREVDVLLIDDIQFLGGKEATLDTFFHTFNALYQANKRIVIASDVPPKNLKGFEARLISRFESGLTVDVKPPDLETRIAILRMIDVEIKPVDIIGQVAKYFHLTCEDLVGRSRTKEVAQARQISMYLAREMTSMSLFDIGQIFGGRDHTTVMHAYTTISDKMQQKQEIYNYVMELTVRLKQRTND